MTIFCQIPFPVFGHEGTTPYRTMEDMKRRGEGPFARSRPYAFALDWLGIDALQMYNSKKEPNGVKIVSLQKDRPAGEGDLERNDIIIGINGFTVLSLDDLNSLMSKIYFEGEFRFTVLRNERETNETLYLKADLAEIDPKISHMISSRGSSEKDFKKGMFQNDFMKLMMGGGDRKAGSGSPGLSPQPAAGGITPTHQKLPSGLSMEQMLRRSPLVHFEGETKPRQSLRRPASRPAGRASESRIERGILQINRYLRQKNQLKITDEQTRLLKNLYNDFLKNKLKLDADLEIQELDLNEILQGNIDLRSARKILQQKQKTKTDKQYLMIQYYKLLKTILTPEQVKKLNL
ncbi:MAG: PDZ domain-containing protein [bacterium]